MLDKFLNMSVVTFQGFSVLTDLVLSESQDLYSSISYVERRFTEDTGREVMITVLLWRKSLSGCRIMIEAIELFISLSGN